MSTRGVLSRGCEHPRILLLGQCHLHEAVAHHRGQGVFFALVLQVPPF